MNTFSGKGKVGLLTAFAVLLMPLLGIGTASAFEVGEKVNVLVPDLQEFAAAPEEHQFTCRAITEHAVWLVQDTSAVDNKGGLGDTSFVPKVVWGSSPTENLVDPDDFAAMTETFENTVWGTTTAFCGVPEDINSDGKVVVILAAIPTKYNSSQSSQTSRNNMYYVNPDFNEIDGEAMEVFYLNIQPYTVNETAMQAAVEFRPYNLPNGLATLAITSNDPDEETWLVRGLAEVAQYQCFGFTQTETGDHGIFEIIEEFRKSPYLDLRNPVTGNQKLDYAPSRGQQFMFLMYFAQRIGMDAIGAVAMDSEHTCMESIAYAIDPSHDPETAVQDLVVPIYRDWLVCNLHNDFRSDFAGGIYMYDFLEGTTWEDFAHVGFSTPFTLSFNSYPDPGQIPGDGSVMGASIWCSQYIRFLDYDQNYLTFFNGQYSDGTGSGSAYNTQWEGQIIICDDEAGEFVSVSPMEFDSQYNSTFNLESANTYLIVTNNLEGGAVGMRYFISNDEIAPNIESAIHQNSVMSQYITVYTTLINNDTDELEGFDWVGPIFEATLVDSTLNIKMSSFYSTLWTGVFSAWDSGTYELSFAGYDSTGHYIETMRDVAVGYADTDITLELDYASLFVPKGGAPSGAMVTLAETDALGLSLESSASIGTARGQMTGVIAGPVTIPEVNGTISFNSTTNEASVYRFTEQGWTMVDSWMQDGQISAAVDQGGIYALGEGIGVFAPEIPAQLVLGANAPNPFSAQTAINFGLPVNGNVRVNVFDMSGRLVNTLANEEMAAANHTIIWDGTDVNGNTVGAGVYFCRLEAAGQVLTQKMLKVQ